MLRNIYFKLVLSPLETMQPFFGNLSHFVEATIEVFIDRFPEFHIDQKAFVHFPKQVLWNFLFRPD